ncbi:MULTISPECIES: hypothetical protein [unclassified Nostoc]|uniref:hypothetical protein n=1 Tax=unclassified Nostoc TaxID=2593658 RepID=UPI002AD1FB33|nr:hypothetical protein [Nostoc sp. DedQUE03]MDZ7977552.1 hypothetical protein [Nostoc sp. DedQUE03]MDZ8049324.1 hypothetical protein [Nostoc sp. DedQUE02]
MASGYVIAKKVAGTTTGYWDGTAFTAAATDDDLLEADFITLVTDARFVQGSVQAANTDVEVVKLAADETITLTP